MMYKYKWSQWKNPIRILFRGYGVVIWKWSGILIPLTTFHFGDSFYFGYDISRHSVGFVFRFIK